MYQFPPSSWVNLQRWSSNCFCKSANSWAQSAIANSHISEICESANFFSLIRKLQICKFCWWASPQIANLQLFQRESSFIKFPPFMAKLSKSQLQVCLAEFFILKKFELEHLRYAFLSRKIKNFQICESCRSAINFTNLQIAKNIGSSNLKFAYCPTCRRSVNVTNFASPQICRFSEAWGKIIHEKNLQRKILWHRPFKAKHISAHKNALM
jgi:hypothetical protein